jgi:ribosome biogenesis GTPase A
MALRKPKSKRSTKFVGDDAEIEELLVDMDPKEYTRGEPGEEITLELLLRVVADVGLVGLPNVGKSSLLVRTPAPRG